jgi:hypothetical protein
MTSALTNSSTPKVPFNNRGAAVLFPAPLGPARTTTFGRVFVFFDARFISPLAQKNSNSHG